VSILFRGWLDTFLSLRDMMPAMPHMNASMEAGMPQGARVASLLAHLG